MVRIIILIRFGHFDDVRLNVNAVLYLLAVVHETSKYYEMKERVNIIWQA